MSGPYSIVGEFYAHDGPVRSLCVGPLGEIVSGCQADSPQVKRWTLSGAMLELTGSPIFHDHWVTAIAASSQMGYVITGCMDSVIRVYDTIGNPVMVLEGHEKGIISFSWSAAGNLISGSWDGSARVWDLRQSGQLLLTLGPHENGVHVLGLPDGRIATTSTGEAVNGKPANFKLRLWDGVSGQQLGDSICDHSGSIRSITGVPGIAGFATTSNDGTVALRGPDGSPVGSMMHPPQDDGSPPFVLDSSLLHTPTGLSVVSGAEDGSVMVCQGMDVLQNIPHPNCVWCVLGLPGTGGDFITGGHDGVIRYFSMDPQLIGSEASLSLQAAFTEQVAASDAKKRKGPSSEEIEKQAKWEARGSHPGKSDQQVMVFNKEGKMIAAQWSGDSSTWIEIGEVTGNSDGGEVNGVMYDHVLPVEIDTPSEGVRCLNIGYNNLESAYDASQRFINENGLEQHYLRQIADWITDRAGKNTPTIGPIGSNSAPAPAAKKYQYFPATAYALYDEVPAGFQGKIIPKIAEFNGLSGESALSQVELEAVEQTVATLTATSSYHFSAVCQKQLNGVVKMATHFESAKAFPAFDICRMLGLHPQGSKSLSSHPLLRDMLRRAMGLLMEGQGLAVNTAVTALRFLVNSFRFDELRQAVLQGVTYVELLDIVERQSGNTNRLVRVSCSALLLNITIQLVHPSVNTQGQTAPLLARAASLSCILLTRETENADIIIRSLVTIGSIGLLSLTLPQSSNASELFSHINSLAVPSKLGAVRAQWTAKLGSQGTACLDELAQLLG